MSKILDFLTDNWLPISGVIEAALRLIPTSKNLSIIDNVFKVISFLIKNRRKPSENDIPETVVGLGDKLSRNVVSVDRFKHIIPVILVMCFSFSVIAPQGAIAQTNSTQKSSRYYNADSATVKSEVSTLDGLYGNVGALYYNSGQDKFRIYYDHAWHDLISGGGGGGVNIYNSDGALTGARTLDGDNNPLTFSDLSTLSLLADDQISITSSNGNIFLNAEEIISINSANDLTMISYGDIDTNTDPFSFAQFGGDNVAGNSTVTIMASTGLGGNQSYINVNADNDVSATGIEIVSQGYVNLGSSGVVEITANSYNIITGSNGFGVDPFILADIDGSSPWGNAGTLMLGSGDVLNETLPASYMTLSNAGTIYLYTVNDNDYSELYIDPSQGVFIQGSQQFNVDAELVQINSVDDIALTTGEDIIINASVNIHAIADNEILIQSESNTATIGSGDLIGHNTPNAYTIFSHDVPGNKSEVLLRSHTGSTNYESYLRLESDGVSGESMAVIFANTYLDLQLNGELQINGDPGTAGYVLTSNGPGNTPIWAPGGGGGTSPASPDRSIQINNSGSFGSDAVYVPSTGNLQLGDNSTSQLEHTISALNSGTSPAWLVFSSESGIAAGGNYIFRNNGDASFPDVQFVFDHPTATTVNGYIRTKGALSQLVAETNFFKVGEPGHTRFLIDASELIHPDNTVVTIGSVGDIVPHGTVTASGGIVGDETGGNLTVKGGNGEPSGNNDGGNLILSPGLAAGTGNNGYIILNNLPTSCSGAPTGALANVGGVLTICP